MQKLWINKNMFSLQNFPKLWFVMQPVS
uniref:Uncharacterized protein n=1 Tax=Rhizophora mucronata TaxID=61149 RepID=A0A2P2PV38_RHIMU